MRSLLTGTMAKARTMTTSSRVPVRRSPRRPSWSSSSRARIALFEIVWALWPVRKGPRNSVAIPDSAESARPRPLLPPSSNSIASSSSASASAPLSSPPPTLSLSSTAAYSYIARPSLFTPSPAFHASLHLWQSVQSHASRFSATSSSTPLSTYNISINLL